MEQPATIGIKLETQDGSVPVEVLADALQNFIGVIDALAKEVVPHISVEWGVDDLRVGSAQVVLAPRAIDDLTTRAAHVFVHEMERVSATLERGDPDTVPFGPQVRAACRKMASCLPDSTHLQLIVGAKAHPVTRIAVAPQPKMDVVLTTIEGKVQRLNARDDQWFYLYEDVHDRRITCWLTGNWAADDLIPFWDKRVAVTGLLTTWRGSGRMEIRDIVRIRPLPTPEIDFSRTEGILKLPLNDDEILDAQRRVWSGE